MRITFRNGFEMTKRELDKKTVEELYDVHCDLCVSYSNHEDKGEIDKLELYINDRIEKEYAVLI